LSAVLLALGASLAWGAGDFVGGLKARTFGTLRVLLWVELGGLASIALVIAVRAAPPDDRAVLLAVPAALSGTLGLYAFYRGMSVGMMSVVAPIAGASAIVPVVFGIATGERPSTLQLAGIACAVTGVVLAAQEHADGGERRLASGVWLAVLAAVGFGFFFPPMHAAGEADPWFAALLFRATAALVVVAVVALRRPNVRLGGPALAIVLLVGVGDTLGSLLFAASAGHGLVSVTSVLASLYPVVTVALAAAVLHEHVAGWQRVGIVLTLSGVGLIAA
jgi:drug/metabolite transporter (DMT)-like permease